MTELELDQAISQFKGSFGSVDGVISVDRAWDQAHLPAIAVYAATPEVLAKMPFTYNGFTVSVTVLRRD